MFARLVVIFAALSAAAVSANAQKWGDEALANTSAQTFVTPLSGQSQQVCNGTDTSLCSAGYPTSPGDGNLANVSISSSSGTATSSASAFANLATGTMGVTASANGPISLDQNGAFSQALMEDTLYFLVTGSSPVTVGVQLTIDGTVQGGYPLTTSLGLANTAGAGTNLGEAVQFWDNRTTHDTPLSLSDAMARDGGQTGTWTQYAAANGTGVIFTGSITIDPLHPDYTLYETLQASVNSQYSPVSIQAGHTATLNLILPVGVSFTSASGKFLTGPNNANAVPEPATWALMLLGFGGIGITLRRGNTARVRSINAAPA